MSTPSRCTEHAAVWWVVPQASAILAPFCLRCHDQELEDAVARERDEHRGLLERFLAIGMIHPPGPPRTIEELRFVLERIDDLLGKLCAFEADVRAVLAEPRQ